jgi:hypothetical protein
VYKEIERGQRFRELTYWRNFMISLRNIEILMRLKNHKILKTQKCEFFSLEMSIYLIVNVEKVSNWVHCGFRFAKKL